MKPPVLVTGAPRSGTTWVGKMLALSPSLGYIHEPFNNDHNVGRLPQHFPENFFYLHSGNETPYRLWLDDVLDYKYYLSRALIKNQGLREKGAHVREWMHFISFRWKRKRPLIKDPLAFFSTPWLSQKFNVRPIVVIRHPAAVISSFKRLNWNITFEHFLNQQQLLTDWLGDHEEEIVQATKQSLSTIQAGILLWKLIYSTVIQYQNRFPEWFYVRHEDLSRDPEQAFHDLFQYISVPYTDAVIKKLRVYIQGNVRSEVPDGANAMYIRINSRENIFNWKKRLSQDEISEIKSQLEPLWRQFYSDEDW